MRSSACRAAGLDSLADEMSLGAGKAMMTLDVRESKSSLAGVMMAAAMEGIGVYQFGEHVLPQLGVTAQAPVEAIDPPGPAENLRPHVDPVPAP